MNAGDPFEWYFEIPIVSRTYFTLSFLTTAACALEIISPLTLYFNYKLIFEKGQVWRLVTNFLFFGMFSLDFLFHMYFLVRYCRLLEDNSFRGRTADFVTFIVFGVVLMSLIAPFVNIPFFGSSLTFMMVYVWGRRNEHVRMSFLGLFPFNAPYLPWVLFTFSLVLGSSATVDLIGIAVGHLYFYFDDVYPSVAEIRGWAPRRYLRFSEYIAPAQHQIEVATAPHGGAAGEPVAAGAAMEPGGAEDAALREQPDGAQAALGGEATAGPASDRAGADQYHARPDSAAPSAPAAARIAAALAAARRREQQQAEDEADEQERLLQRESDLALPNSQPESLAEDSSPTSTAAPEGGIDAPADGAKDGAEPEWARSPLLAPDPTQHVGDGAADSAESEAPAAASTLRRRRGSADASSSSAAAAAAAASG